MGINATQMYIMPVIYAQCWLCEYQEQLILPSLVSIFNIVIYLSKCVKGVYRLLYI